MSDSLSRYHKKYVRCNSCSHLTPLSFIIISIFLNIWPLKDLTRSFRASLASCFSLGAQLILLLLFLVFVKRWNPDTADTGEAGASPDRNVKITSSDVKIYILFLLNRIYNNTLPPSGITIKSKYC